MPQTWKTLSFILILGLVTISVSNQNLVMEEICDNGIDDNDDGLIDLNDPDCICEMVSMESLIPNPSFEDYNCCPDADSQLACADSWDQASTATTDYIHTCDYLTAGIEMLPFPDGEGAILFLDGSFEGVNGPEVYSEYAGVCLNSPMEKDSIYQFKFYLGFLNDENSPPINFSFFGSPSCANLPFTLGVDCPTNYPDWYLLNSKYILVESDTAIWVEVSIDIQPEQDINALVIGGDCNNNYSGILGIYFLDDLILNDKNNFDFESVDMGHPCNEDFVFAVVETPNLLYQWYKEGIALIGETDPELSQMYGEGYYQLRIIKAGTQQCRVVDEFEFFLPVYESEVFVTICEGENLQYQGDVIEEEGIYNYSLTSIQGCDSLVVLNVTERENTIDTIYAQTLLGTSYQLGDYQFEEEGNYEINLTTKDGCDSTIVLQLEYLYVYIPNGFSPNGDSNNDYFEVYTANNDIIITEMSIFDRWGNLIFVGEKWDGTHNNKFVNPGIFVYMVRLINQAGEEVNFNGSLTLVR